MPPETRVLVAPLAGRRPRLSRSRSRSSARSWPSTWCKDWHEGCERCLQLLRFGGTGHTMGIHSRDDAVIREFALKKPVFRIVVNTQTSMGATGYTTGLAPSMSLGLRRLCRQHHLRQHHAPPPHQHEAAGLRAARASPRPSLAPPAPGGGPARPRPRLRRSVDFVCEDDVRRALREGRTPPGQARGASSPRPPATWPQARGVLCFRRLMARPSERGSLL